MPMSADTNTLWSSRTGASGSRSAARSSTTRPYGPMGSSALSCEAGARAPPRTLNELFAECVRLRPDKVALRQRTDAGEWIAVTWSVYAARVHALGAALVALGVERGDLVAVFSASR